MGKRHKNSPAREEFLRISANFGANAIVGTTEPNPGEEEVYTILLANGEKATITQTDDGVRVTWTGGIE